MESSVVKLNMQKSPLVREYSYLRSLAAVVGASGPPLLHIAGRNT